MSDEEMPVESEASVEEAQPVESTEPEAPVEQPERQTSGYWDKLRSLPEFHGQDERAVASRLYQAMQRERAASQTLQQYQQVMPYAQEYLQNRQDYEAWKQTRNQQQQQQQQPQPKEEPAKWWNPPKVTDAHRRWLVRNEEGREVIHPDAPLDARNAITEHQAYVADFARRFLENPEEALGPMVEQFAQRKAQELIESRAQEEAATGYVKSLEEQNRDWLYEPGTNTATPEGLLVHKYIEDAVSKGIDGPKVRWEWAVTKTERDSLAEENQYLRSQLEAFSRGVPQQQAAPVAQPQQPDRVPPPVVQDQDQRAMDYLRKEAARRPSRSAGSASNDVRVPRPKQSFAEMLREDASSRGLL